MPTREPSTYVLKCRPVRELPDGFEFELPGLEPVWLVMNRDDVKIGTDTGCRALTTDESRDLDAALDDFAARRLAVAIADRIYRVG